MIYNQVPFDATKEHEFLYSYSGNQQFKVEMIIRKNSTDEIVYQGIQTTFLLKYVLPANSIPNGQDYTAQILVYDKDNDPSPLSDKKFFSCFLTPIFYIENLAEHQIVGNSNYSINIYYSQATNELLDYYIVNLMDYSGKVIQTSGSVYAVSGSMTYSLTGLLDNAQYKIQILGKTLNGMNIAAGVIEFSVDYIAPSSFVLVQLENIPQQASVKIKSNIILIDGKSNPEPPIYINDESVNLTNPEHWVRFDQGFSIERDFAISIECRSMQENKIFFKLSDGSSNNTITLQKGRGIFNGVEQNYLVLHATNKSIRYRCVSNLIPTILDHEWVSIEIVRQNNLFNVTIRRVV